MVSATLWASARSDPCRSDRPEPAGKQACLGKERAPGALRYFCLRRGNHPPLAGAWVAPAFEKQ